MPAPAITIRKEGALPHRNRIPAGPSNGEAHERELEHQLDEADKHWIIDGLRNRRASREVSEQRDLMSRRA